MRRIIGLVLVTCLFMACGSGGRLNQGNVMGELIVFNQSSSCLWSIKYCGRDFKYEDSSYYGKHDLPIGKKSSIQLDDVARGNVFFKVSDDQEEPIIEVRTAMEVVVKKGESYVLTITDSTLVIPTGSTEPSPLLQLTSPAILKIENRASRQLNDVKYKEKGFYNSSYDGEHLSVGKGAIGKFYGIDKASDYVYFWLARHNVKVEEEVEIKRGETTTLVIDDDTPIIKNGRVKRVKLSELEAQGFEIVNNTSYDLYDVEVSYAGGDKRYKDSLERDDAWYVGFAGEKDSYGGLRKTYVSMSFKIKSTSGLEKKFHLKDFPCLSLNTTEEVILLDDSEVNIENSSGGIVYAGKLKDNVD